MGDNQLSRTMQGYKKNHLPPSRRPYDDGNRSTCTPLFNSLLTEIVRIAIAIVCFAMYQQRCTTQNAVSKPSSTGLDTMQSVLIGSQRFILPTAYDRDFWSVPSPPNQKSNFSLVVTSRHQNGSIYGGSNETHLGGFTEKDLSGISTNVWNWMMGLLGVKSVLDIGCGRGHSSHYFLSKKARVLCVEGSVDAVSNSVLPRDHIVEHDFSKGPWWPTETFDACW